MKENIPDTLVHYYTNEEHLFRSVTSYDEDKLDEDFKELPLNSKAFHIKEFPAIYEESLKYEKHGFEFQIWDRAIVDEIIRKNKEMKG
ncbi:MAG: hypothetical protein PF638_16460 [Candidatus Delongbacteria bacterium]|jgi:hypothetical protein|nr:hypothetical protein [Candidatus Delongbacteria bacterium]